MLLEWGHILYNKAFMDRGIGYLHTLDANLAGRLYEVIYALISDL